MRYTIPTCLGEREKLFQYNTVSAAGCFVTGREWPAVLTRVKIVQTLLYLM